MSDVTPRRLRARLVLLVALAVLPAIVLITATGITQRKRSVETGRQTAVRISASIADELDRLIDGGRQLLAVISALPEVREGLPPRCSVLLARLLRENERYANIGAVDADGNVVCSGVPLREPVNVADRVYFRDALRTRAFAIGEFQIGRISGKPSINFGLPLEGPREGGPVVVFAALDITFLESLPLEIRFPPGSALSVLDRSGTILARHPDPEQWRGKRVPEAPIVRAILARKRGTIEAAGVDGVTRLFAFRPLTGGSAFVSVGVGLGEITGTANRALLVNISGLLAIGLMALFAAWVFGDRIVVAPVTRALGAEQAAAVRERHAAEALRAADDIKNTFLAAVGHDLRNPVAAIKGFAYILRKSFDRIEEDDRDKMLAAIENASVRLERLLDSLLDLQRLQHGTIEPIRTEVEVLEVARRVVSEIDARDHEIEVIGEPFSASLDLTEYERIIDNLVTNAVKYSRSGTSVTVRLARVDGGLQITVEDRGPGVFDDDKPRIFQAFRRGPTGGASGMGVGLFLVARFAELHGGRAWVEDREGGGARFRVFLADPG